MLELARELRRRHRGLWLVGTLNLGLAVVFLALALVDERTITGLNVWIKPFKFAVSVGLYLLTVAWFLPHLRLPRRVLSGLGWAIAVTLLLENALVDSQAARGVPSHFNFETGYDAAVFAAMGILIAVNSLLATVLLVLFMVRPAALPAPYLWGIRLGFLLLLLGSAQGGLMIANGAHTVGSADGGPGLPFLGWSTVTGDYRPAHLIGLHGLQVLPLIGYSLSRRKGWSVVRQTATLLAAAAGYFLLGAWLLLQAQAAQPLVPW